MRHSRNHRRLVADCVNLCGCSYRLLFVIACCYDSDNTPEEDKEYAMGFLDEFEVKGVVPDFMEDFLIDVIVGRIPILDETGQVLNPMKGVRIESQTNEKGV